MHKAWSKQLTGCSMTQTHRLGPCVNARHRRCATASACVGWQHCCYHRLRRVRQYVGRSQWLDSVDQELAARTDGPAPRSRHCRADGPAPPPAGLRRQAGDQHRDLDIAVLTGQHHRRAGRRARPAPAPRSRRRSAAGQHHRRAGCRARPAPAPRSRRCSAAGQHHRRAGCRARPVTSTTISTPQCCRPAPPPCGLPRRASTSTTISTLQCCQPEPPLCGLPRQAGDQHHDLDAAVLPASTTISIVAPSDDLRTFAGNRQGAGVFSALFRHRRKKSTERFR